MRQSERLTVSVAHEGGLYSLNRRWDAPIRIFADRHVEDDYLIRFGRSRSRLSKNEYRKVLRAAKANRVAGRA